MSAKKLTLVVATFSVAAAISGNALAADPVQDYEHDWSGFYIGAHVGYGGANVSGQYDFDDVSAGDTFEDDGHGPFDLDPEGFLGGAQVGYNWQSGNFVLGLEADITFTDWSDSVRSDSDTEEEMSTKTDFVGTLRGRAGVAIDQFLLFGTAGLALTDTKFTANDDVDDTDPDEIGSVNFNDIGIVVGGGAEYALNESWSIKAEALYFIFNDKKDTGDLTDDSELGDYAELDDAWMVRVGVNFHF